ncbi:MAG: AAA family ATPase [Angelakisella sp.]
MSQQWHMPLLRLDVGRLMGSYVGESEARTREMIQIAEAMAPCVLWIDEVDKGFAGIGGVQGDSGAQARVRQFDHMDAGKEIPGIHRCHRQ